MAWDGIERRQTQQEQINNITLRLQVLHSDLQWMKKLAYFAIITMISMIASFFTYVFPIIQDMLKHQHH
jgi:hypothetical protein